MFKPKKKRLYRVRWLQPSSYKLAPPYWREHHFQTKWRAERMLAMVKKGSSNQMFGGAKPAIEAYLDISDPVWFPVDEFRTDEIPENVPEPEAQKLTHHTGVEANVISNGTMTVSNNDWNIGLASAIHWNTPVPPPGVGMTSIGESVKNHHLVTGHSVVKQADPLFYMCMECKIKWEPKGTSYTMTKSLKKPVKKKTPPEKAPNSQIYHYEMALPSPHEFEEKTAKMIKLLTKQSKKLKF